MKLILFTAFLLVGACVLAQGDNDDEMKDPEEDYCDIEETCTDDNFEKLLHIFVRVDYELSRTEETFPAPSRRRRSAGYNYGYNSLSARAPFFSGPGYAGGYRGYEQGSYRQPLQKEHRSFHYTVPKPSYHKSFREGKWHLDNKHIVKNYYKKGTYEVAKKYFIALPFVKIIPVKTTTSVDYIGELQTYSGYRVRLCEHCYNGYPQLEFQSLQSPSKNVIRRFNFLPQTKRTRTEYGHPKVVQTGNAHVSYDQGHAYQGQYRNAYPGNY